MITSQAKHVIQFGLPKGAEYKPGKVSMPWDWYPAQELREASPVPVHSPESVAQAAAILAQLEEQEV
ncbi:hypothetical protein L336_1017 [Candidatus Saccharimonas aalborgensis]|jgi:hypothetical protein|uniref:Uncharacterized protein n=1 Tax=Candidatus Saccharimonas aalborgensis TaxID=1332188 RepID=R4PZN8_9BACT|nr:hypothetical protein [Candidatus Saccharimonas aalborgensis]AGL62716.1 hypothetical protein L336_1017 [Candidatus Saccharimonas aalborgensis]